MLYITNVLGSQSPPKSFSPLRPSVKVPPVRDGLQTVTVSKALCMSLFISNGKIVQSFFQDFYSAFGCKFYWSLKNYSKSGLDSLKLEKKTVSARVLKAHLVLGDIYPNSLLAALTGKKTGA